ncbi:hypothetical protein O0I10_008458 [Lichtheimia ornata]|uniref:HSF-type DNA-binding domain-containing protein n=1 Tax=Lichtheimia ornata TaxID=688661 RepID=A0AAD7UYB3_9FUNG|nr:uncharacterized protein O0I10_008458 [Lichtheimia ornata]KAJ8655794.1 hypothetical protein O0I10_008458 [Lichtheimia ornata]
MIDGTSTDHLPQHDALNRIIRTNPTNNSNDDHDESRHDNLIESTEQSPAAVSGTNDADSSSGSVMRTQAAFVNKLYKMLEDPSIHHLISWSENGELFSVSNPTSFSKVVLPQYFKHNNWQSFVRQLNMYGFHKVNDMIHSNLTNENQNWEFRHPSFKRGAVDDLKNIKRKSAKSRHQSQSRMHLPTSQFSDADDYLYGPMYKRIVSTEERLHNALAAFEVLQNEATALRNVISGQQEIISGVVSLLMSLYQKQGDTPHIIKAEGIQKRIKVLSDQMASIPPTSARFAPDMSQQRLPSITSGPSSFANGFDTTATATTPTTGTMSYPTASRYNNNNNNNTPDPVPTRIPSSSLQDNVHNAPRQPLSESTLLNGNGNDNHIRTHSSILSFGSRSQLLNPQPSSSQSFSSSISPSQSPKGKGVKRIRAEDL